MQQIHNHNQHRSKNYHSCRACVVVKQLVLYHTCELIGKSCCVSTLQHSCPGWQLFTTPLDHQSSQGRGSHGQSVAVLHRQI